MSFKNLRREKSFEEYIASKLKENGWQVSDTDKGFDSSTALYISDFVEFLKATAPAKLEKMQESFKDNWQKNLQRKLIESLEDKEKGTVLTLREGFKMAGYQTIECMTKYPDDPRLKDEEGKYQSNILRVMRQVHYQTAGNKSLDLVFFVNGIPVATAEVKTEMTQKVQDAVAEYQNERKPIEPGTKRKNPLLIYKRGAVVHFAISEEEIWMCTNLNGDKPRFLPFNKGNDGHAGNPESENNDYPVSYFWNEICLPDNWIQIFQKFVFEETSKKEDATGKLKTVYKLIFPRFHQWDCVTKLMADVRARGACGRYLIEHSAGSGKTETISWTAHDLNNVRNDNGEKVFSSVVVVTDRLSLDTNIKKTIKQLNGTSGFIEMVGRDDVGKRTSSKSKHKQLAKALAEKREIIVVTLQTFLYAWNEIVHSKELSGCNFAVIIDEAHNSQTGSNAAALKSAFNVAGDKSKLKEIKAVSTDDMTDEDVIDEYFRLMQANNVMPKNVSFFAFTATPKAETKTLFGQPGKETDPKSGEPIPVSFHLYPMRQAIEEGYILDPLSGYMPYSTAVKLSEDVAANTIVDESKARQTIARWKSLHPTNVTNKAEFIIEHFVKNVATLLNGQAKAMIVTSSRPAVIRYKYAIEAYLNAHPEYDRRKIASHLQFKVPGEPLVAFSDSVRGEKCIMSEDSLLKDNPFALIKRDYEYTEVNTNKLGQEAVENAFDRPKYRLLIVANKFQTGFDQPKLCAMYIDKTLANDIEIVQTYSRINRIFPGKDQIFIIDFVNDANTVLRAFKKYDLGAEMKKAQNMEIVYEIKKELDSADVYTQSDFETYKNIRYQAIKDIQEGKENKYRQALYKSLDQPTRRWNTLYENCRAARKTLEDLYQEWLSRENADEAGSVKVKLEEAQEELDLVLDFRKKLKRYVSAYSFISQIINLGEPDMEVFFGFAKLLAHRLQGVAAEEIDIRNLVLSDYKISKLSVPGPAEVTPLRPMGKGGKTKSSRRESLKIIIQKLNEIWGSDINLLDGARAVNIISDHVVTDNITKTQITNSTNSKAAVIADGRLKNLIKRALLAMINNDLEPLATKAMEDQQSLEPLAEQVYDQIASGQRYDISELQEFIEEEKKRSVP